MLVHIKFIQPEDLTPDKLGPAALGIFENIKTALSGIGKEFDPMSEIRRTYRENIYPEIIQEGVYDAWNLETYFQYCTSHIVKNSTPAFGDLPSFGVCDTVGQVMDKYSRYICNSKESYIVQMCTITKDSKASLGDLWKWADHGQYIGKQTPTTEMLKDEPNIDKVYMFKILEVEEKN